MSDEYEFDEAAGDGHAIDEAESLDVSPVEEGDLIEPGVVCAHCMASNRPMDEFCCECGMPIGQYVWNQPFQQIAASGWAYQRATSGRISRVMIIGIWLIFGPGVVIAPVMLISAMLSGSHITMSVGDAPGGSNPRLVSPDDILERDMDTGRWTQWLLLLGQIAGGCLELALYIVYVMILVRVTRAYQRQRLDAPHQSPS
ncbi:MAG: hypothetical protein GC162_01120 [Planctomycetes bacterium]|nr:hypothetical protein [Planctomycetota bacterium]